MTRTARPPWLAWLGLALISAVAIFTSVSPYLADWNETHIYNPYWPPHAKFHNAQTMVFGALAGALALGVVWWPGRTRLRLRVGALFAALYWVTQFPAIWFPGTSFTDPKIQGLPPLVVFGHVTNQAELDIVVVAIVAVGYAFAGRSVPRGRAPDGIA